MRAPEELCQAIAAGLPGGPRPPPDGWPLTAEILRTSRLHRVQGLVWRAVENGTLRADRAMTDDARHQWQEGLRASLAVEEAAVQALRSFAASGIETRALKGLALAHLDHVDPAERIFNDVDLLVRRGDYDRAVSGLIDAGFKRAEPAVRDWWERRFGKAVVLLSSNGRELDLHLRITGGYFGEQINHDDLWSRASKPFELGGVAVRGLDREDRLLHACCHVLLGGWSGLRAEHDVAQLVLVSAADWTAVVQRAERDGIDLVVAEALRATWTDLQLDRSHPAICWADDHREDLKQTEALASYQSAMRRGTWGSEGLGMLGALSVLNRARFLVGLAWPSTASLNHRQRSRRDHLRQSVGLFRGSR